MAGKLNKLETNMLLWRTGEKKIVFDGIGRLNAPQHVGAGSKLRRTP
jgi:hypothetical protein